MDMFTTQAFTVPGTQDELLYERAESGRLVRLSCNGRSYLEEREDGRILEELATVSEVMLPNGLLRHVRAPGQTWTEEYLWDETGRLARVDGVEVRRDEHHRVTACLDWYGGNAGACDWLYAYADDDLAVIDYPQGVRHLTRGTGGRPIRFREGARRVQIAYNPAGDRRDVPLAPENWHRDELGRLWTVVGPNGAVRTTYLWDGFACLGRIDGPPGAPLAAVYSLDPSCTPVRIITRTEVRRIPRDAFGEGLLAHPGTPGLYGGAIHAGLVYLRARVLDPPTGAFNLPDPWHGLEDDPRRAGGYRGPLMVENEAAGPYAVCQNDPVGRADPTGEVSWWLILSDFTWSLQNNLLGWFGLDAVINFWGSLFTGNARRFVDFEALSSSNRLGSFGVRRDGMVTYKNPARAWTFQHSVWSVPEEFTDLMSARVFDPKGAFRPTLYGTILRGVPEEGFPFMLRGAKQLGNIAASDLALNWSRAGWRAEPVIPSSPAPHFPAGGLHFDSPLKALRCPQNCTVTELEPTATLGRGTIEDRVVIVVPVTGLNLNTDDLVLLSDAGPGVVISRVLAATQEGQTTRVRLETVAATADVGPNGVRLRGLGAPSSTESLSAVTPNPGPGPDNHHLRTTGTSAPYARGDVLRLRQGGVQVGAAIVRRLEARVQLDAPLPNTLTPPLVVTLAQRGGSPNPASLTSDGQVLDFPVGQPIPAEGDTIVVTRGANEIAVTVTAGPADRQRHLDRSVSALGTSGDAVTWQPLVRGMELGERAEAPEADPVITYERGAEGKPPSSGFMRVEASDGQAVRRVSGLVYDALVLSSALPGNTGAPYDVDRLPIQPPDQENLTIKVLQTLALSPSVALDGVALQLHQFSGPAVIAGPVPGPVPSATIAGGVASVTLPAGPTASPPRTQPTPSQLVVLRQATNIEPAFVARVRLTITFDRNLRLSASGLQVVSLAVGGPAYQAERRDALLVTVRPEIAGAGLVHRVQMPRFGVGELVEANWTGATRAHQYHVTAVEGTNLTLAGDADLPPSTPGLTVARLVPDDPKTGGSRAGIEGVPVNAAADGTTRQVRFRVWRPDTLVPASASAVVRVGLVDGSTVHPAVVDGSAPRPLEIEFATTPTLSGPGVDITVPSLTDTGYAASFTQEGAAVFIRDDPPPLAAPGTNLVVAVPFSETDRRAAGELSAGSVLVPEDPENAELDRRQSLTDHELRHTLQSAMWGPLLLGLFPLAALEGVLELTTDIELPTFSMYVGGALESEGPNRFLRIPNPGDIDFRAGDNVQMTLGGTPRTVSLGQREGDDRFRITVGLEVPSGPVQVRRQTPANTWRDAPFNVLQALTHGGMLNLLAGSVYGSQIFGLAKLFYALGRVIGGPGVNYAATVEDEGRRLRLADEAGRIALRGASRVIVQDRSGENALVRSVAGEIAHGVVSLVSPVELRDEVRIAPYSTHTPDSYWDWHDYFPAAVPDPARPAAVRVDPVNGRRLDLRPFDRVAVTAGGVSRRTNVTAVTTEGVELEEAPPTSGEARDFRIAKVDSRDPMGNADSFLMTELGMGWLRWAFDPYGQLQFRLQPRPDSFWGIAARIARYVFGSQSWSAVFPGYFFWDNAFKQAGSSPKGHLSQMEQDASEESGDLYSPVGRLRGSLSVVGDVARYWYFISDRDGTVVMRGRQEAPGVHIDDGPRVVPSLDTGGGGTNEPNLGAQIDPAVTDPGLDVPDILFNKADVNPKGPNATNPEGFQPALRGWLPASPVLERSSGVYATFSRPGTHRITVRNGVNDADQGGEAQREGKQTLFFDVNPQDVAVTMGGLPVAQGATITLVQTQRAKVSVIPNAERRYAATLTRPITGEVLRSDGDLVIVAQTDNGTEPVEISRVYRYDAARDAFDSGGLVQHGLHLPTDLHIAVRNFEIEVVDTLPVRSSVSTDPTSIVTTSLLPGQEAFVLVPTAILSPLRLASPSGAGAPSLTIGVETLPDAVRPFVGDGGIFSIAFPANDPPEEPVDLLFRVDVGVPGRSASLEASARLTPHFRLVPQGGGTNFQVVRGTVITLTCTEGVDAGAVVVTPSAGVTTAVAGSEVTVTVEAGAAVGPRRILVDDAADPLRKARRTIEIV